MILLGKHMRAYDILSLLRDKDVSFRTIQHGLTHNGLASAKGWEAALDYYNEIYDSESDEIVKNLYLSQLYYGKRTVYFRSLSDVNDKNVKNTVDVINRIFTTSKHKDIKTYKNSYPYILDNKSLFNLKLNNPCPVHIDDNANEIRVVMTYPRAYKQRDTFDINDIDFDGNQPKQLDGYEEIIGIKSGRAQSFDSILFNKLNGVLQIQIDHSRNIINEEIDNANLRYWNMISNEFNTWLKIQSPFKKINLFDKINELYVSGDGLINTLSHSTGTGSVKKERMRRRDEDLRREKFHQVGLQAINGDTNNYNITKQWDGECGTALKLTIDAGVAAISQSNPTVNCAIIEGCITESDFNFLVSKVI